MGTGRLKGYVFKTLRRGGKGLQVANLKCTLRNVSRKEICRNVAIMIIFCA